MEAREQFELETGALLDAEVRAALVRGWKTTAEAYRDGLDAAGLGGEYIPNPVKVPRT